MIKLYSERMEIFLSEYIYMVILRCVVQKLCVTENCLPPGLSIANLRYYPIFLYLLNFVSNKLTLPDLFSLC